MQRHPFRAVIALLTTFAVLASACGGDDDSSSAATPTVEQYAATDTGASPTAAPSDPGTPDAALVFQLGTILLGTGYTEVIDTCLVAASETNQPFATAVNAIAGNERALEFSEFTTMITAVRDCSDTSTMIDQVSTRLLLGDSNADLTSCLRTQVADDDTTLAGLMAVAVSFPIDDTTRPQTVAALAACVDESTIAEQMAASTEQSSGYLDSVDRDCVLALLEGVDLTGFWESELNAAATGLADLEAGLAECAAGPWDDLLDAVPADFEPWAGTRALAEVAAPARNDVYGDAPPMMLEPGVDYRAVLVTDVGRIEVDLFESEAPLAVNSFVALARDGFYDRTYFHRVIADFMAQAGDPTGAGSGGAGYVFDDEVDTGRTYDTRGLLAMAHPDAPDSNGSQWFVTFAETPWLDGIHTIFGEVSSGDEVLDAIALRDPQAQPTAAPTWLETVEIVEA